MEVGTSLGLYCWVRKALLQCVSVGKMERCAFGPSLSLGILLRPSQGQCLPSTGGVTLSGCKIPTWLLAHSPSLGKRREMEEGKTSTCLSGDTSEN